MPRRRRRSPFRFLLIALAVLLVLGVGAVVTAFALVDPNAYKPEIVAAVKRSTGRDLELSGPLVLSRSLTPTVEASGIALSNMEGGSRPQMLTLAHAEAQIALWPLLSGRIVVERLVLIEPDLLLETNAAGRRNWQFERERPATAPASSAPAAPSTGRFVVETMHVRDGRVSWRDGRDGTGGSATVPRVDATDSEAQGQARTTATGEVLLRNQPIAISAETGPWGDIQDPSSSLSWPLQVTASSGNAHVTMSGTVARPLEARGYTLVLQGTAPDLSTLSALAGVRLPPLHDLRVAGNLSDAGGGFDPSALSLHVGASDLSSIDPGFSIERADVSAPRSDQPIRADVQGTLAGAPLQLAAQFGALRSFLAPRGAADSAFPVEITGQAAGATVSAKGAVARPATLAGLDLAIAARIPDLASLSALAGRRLPPLHDLSVSSRITDNGEGAARGIVLHDFTVELPQGDAAGDVTLGFGPQWSGQATLASKRIDADALFAVLRDTAIAPPPPNSAAPAVAAPAAAPPAPAAASPAPQSPLVLSAAPLPWDRLRERNADLRWTVTELRSGASSVHDVVLHLANQAGRLSFEAEAGPAAPNRPDGSLTLNAVQTPPTAALTVHLASLPLKPLLDLFGLPDDVVGNAELDADLHGEGASLHDLAAGLDGHVGLAMVDADIDNRLLEAVLGDVLKEAKLPGDVGAGRTKLRCLAVRLDAVHGVVTANALLLDTTRLLLQGGGTLSFGDEALALRLRPLLRVGGPGLVLPVRVGGTLRHPNAGLDAGGGMEALASLAGRAPPQAAERGTDACGPALALARGGRPGPAAPPPAAPASTKAPNAAELLRALGR